MLSELLGKLQCQYFFHHFYFAYFRKNKAIKL